MFKNEMGQAMSDMTKNVKLREQKILELETKVKRLTQDERRLDYMDKNSPPGKSFREWIDIQLTREG